MKKAKLGRATPEQRERARLHSERCRRAHGIGADMSANGREWECVRQPFADLIVRLGSSHVKR